MERRTRGPVHVVLVEGDGVRRAKLAAALRADGCRVDEANGLQEAEVLLRLAALPGGVADPIDLVASDLAEAGIVDLVSALCWRGWRLPLVGFYGCDAEALRQEVRSRLGDESRLDRLGHVVGDNAKSERRQER